MKIRPADQEDRQIIAHFVRETLRHDESLGGHPLNPDKTYWQKYSTKIGRYFGEKERLFLIAQVGEEMAGGLCGKTVHTSNSFESQRSFHIDILYVAPEFRKRGIAKSLMREALSWASEQSCQESSLFVMCNNTRANEFYKSLDFEPFQYKLRRKLPENPTDRPHADRPHLVDCERGS